MKASIKLFVFLTVVLFLMSAFSCNCLVRKAKSFANLFFGEDSSKEHWDNEKILNEKYLDYVITGEITNTVSLKKIKIQNYYAAMSIRTSETATHIQYTTKGISEKFIKITEEKDSFTLTEINCYKNKDRPRGKIVSSIEIIIPNDMAFDTFEVSTCNKTEIIGRIKGTMKLHTGIGETTVDLKDSQLDSFELDTGTADCRIESFSAAAFTCDSGVAKLVLKNCSVQNPTISAGGEFDFVGNASGNMKLRTDIGKVSVDLKDSQLDSLQLETGVAEIRIENFSYKELVLDGDERLLTLKNITQGN